MAPTLSILKFSALLILSNYVFSSQQYQPCLGTAKPKGSGDYTFALAQVDDHHDPVGPQAACYYSCGAEIVTQSSNKGDMSGLTLMDNAATFLTASGFLKVGESYYLNHLGMSDLEGSNGIGCIHVKAGNHLEHYPKNHAMCSKAKAAVCGFWGWQSIPAQPKEAKPKSPPASKTPKAPPPKTSGHSKRPKPTRKPKPKPKPKTSSASPKSSVRVEPSTSITIVPTQTVLQTNESIDVSPSVPHTIISDLAVLTETQVVSPSSTSTAVVNEESATVEVSTTVSAPEVAVDSDKFKVNGKNFHVINKFEKSLASADKMCVQNKAEIASLTSQSLTAVSEKLKEMTQSKVIIGAWNGDGYSLSGENCLILEASQGIYPGTCSEATAILCQSV